MALKPEPMQRTVIVSSKGHQKTIIETLHSLHVAHFNDFTETREGEFADLRIGRPLPEAGQASAVLVRLRALIRQLGIEGHTPSRVVEARDIEHRIATATGEIESEINQAAEERTRTTTSLERLAEEESRLQPLASLPLRIEDYRGYENLQVFVGNVAEPLGDDLRAVVPDYQLYEGEGGFVALFVPKSRAAAASDVLFKKGFREHPVPEGEGAVNERLSAIARERADLERRLASAESVLATLRERHSDFIIAAEEHLSIEVAKAEAPLSFASTENAFVIDAWVPAGDVHKVESALVRATNGNVHVEHVAHSPHAMHGVDDAYGGSDTHEAGHAPHGHGEERGQPPTKLRNAAAAKPFQFFVEMFSTPKYDEVDPTAVLSIAFPLFFGFMIGDLGLGLVMAVLGYFMWKRLGHVEGVKELGFAILIAGAIAAFFGGIVFMDAFGIPLGSNSHIAHEVEEAIAAGGAGGAGDVVIQAAAGTPACQDIYRYVGEATWGCLLTGGANAWNFEPLIFKVTDVQTMLLISIAAALVHLGVGLIFGIKNELGHGVKHVVAKFSFLLLLLTFFPAAWALLAGEHWSGTTGLAESTAYLIAGGGFVIGGILLGWSEGIVGVLEIPAMFSAILSYLRLGAVAIAKGAMAIAFNKMTLVDIGLTGGSIALLVLGLLAFILVQALLFVLGVLSSGIQAIRLNYVEFFTKFYKGGGEKFSPFGHVRRYSREAPAASVGGGKL